MRRFLSGVLGLWLISNAAAINVTLDYTYDEGYFDGNPEAKAAMIQAAADLSSALGSVLATVNAVETDKFVGSDPTLTLISEIDWDLRVPNPANPDPASPIILDEFTLAADEIRVFVGAADVLTGTTDVLGEGAPVTGQFGISYFEPQTPLEETAMAGAILSAVNYSNGILLRGAGPMITAKAESFPFPAPGQTDLTVRLGALAGFLTFDKGAAWHFNHLTPVEEGKFDFYTVMLHEMLHALGFGSSESWEEKIEGTSWTGAHVIALKGSGAGLIDPEGSHVAVDTMSKTVAKLDDQVSVMTAGLEPGQRRYLTELDLAFLRDIGFGPASAAPTPPPLPTPTPTPPPPTPEPEPASESPPEAPIFAGKAKFTTSKSKVQLKGTVFGDGVQVLYKVGKKGKFLKAKGGGAWRIKVKLLPGKNIITIITFDPETGEMSKPRKIVVKRI